MLRHLPALLLTAFACADDPLRWEQLPQLPDPLGVAAPFAGVSGSALIVAGGANFPNGLPWEGGRKAWTDRVWILEEPHAAWRQIGKLAHPLAYGVCVSHRGGVVCVGGSDAEHHFAEVFRLVWKDGALASESLAPLPIALAGAGGALDGDTLFLACGAEQPGENAATNRAFALDLSAKNSAWRELPPLPGKPRIFPVAAARSGTFFLFGGAALGPGPAGKTSRVYLRDAWAYRTEQGWRRLNDLPKPCVAAPSPAPFLDGKILLISGDDGSLAGFTPPEKHPGFPKAVLAYDPARDRWSEVGETPAPRATVPCVEWRGTFTIPSGEVRPGVRSSETWSIRPR